MELERALIAKVAEDSTIMSFERCYRYFFDVFEKLEHDVIIGDSRKIASNFMKKEDKYVWDLVIRCIVPICPNGEQLKAICDITEYLRMKNTLFRELMACLTENIGTSREEFVKLFIETKISKSFICDLIGLISEEPKILHHNIMQLLLGEALKFSSPSSQVDVSFFVESH